MGARGAVSESFGRLDPKWVVWPLSEGSPQLECWANGQTGCRTSAVPAGWRHLGNPVNAAGPGEGDAARGGCSARTESQEPGPRAEEGLEAGFVLKPEPRALLLFL